MNDVTVAVQEDVAGHEGLRAKALGARYEAGARGAAWLKVKPAQTLDLVVLAAEWGHGRRSGRLSNLHLGARDLDAGGFVMLGKTFKGMTDQMLEWQTTKLLELETSRDRYTVYVRPELVVEVAFNDVQASPQYPGGLTLRFARVKRYRPDKGPDLADTIATVRELHRRGRGGGGGAAAPRRPRPAPASLNGPGRGRRVPRSKRPPRPRAAPRAMLAATRSMTTARSWSWGP